ncbi:hypothetical protein DPV78_012930 [Talaromyces pinophilus]|nr:hypothetical protein DPV78_012930 [Talaromyces pinophilus]
MTLAREALKIGHSVCSSALAALPIRHFDHDPEQLALQDMRLSNNPFQECGLTAAYWTDDRDKTTSGRGLKGECNASSIWWRGFPPKDDILHGYDYISLIPKKRTGDGLWKGR